MSSGLGFRPRVCQDAEAPGVNLGDEIPRRWKKRPGVGAEIAEAQVVRLRDVLLEHLAGALELSRIDGDADQLLHVDELAEFVRVHADEGGCERRIERLAAAENPDLRLLGVRLRMKVHGAAAEKHEARDAFVNRRQEDVARVERDVEVFGVNRQVGGGELPVLVKRDLVETLHCRQARLVEDLEHVAPVLQIELPGGDASALAVLHEHVDDETVAFRGDRAAERNALAFFHDDARGARLNFRAAEVGGARAIRVARDKIEIADDIAGEHELLEMIEEPLNVVG